MTEVTEQIPHENEDLLKIPVDQIINCNICNLPYIYRSKFEFCKPASTSELSKTHSKPLIFYHHTEDSDYTSQIKQLLGTVHKADNQIVTDYYTDDSAETHYLSSNPVSFLIIGKPDIGQSELAQLISDHFKCVYISPESVLKEEITNDTRAGKCIKYNLEAGRSIGPEVILRLVEKRIKSQSVQHRGYVLSGFPMLANEFFKEDPISSESAVFNVQEIFEDLLPKELLPDKPGSVSLIVESEVSVTASKDKEEEKSEGTLESEEGKKEPKSVKYLPKKSEIHLSKDLDLGPSDITIVTHAEPFYTLRDPSEQLTFIQNLLEHPLIIIYVMCGTIDVHNKREKYRYNIYLQREIFFSPDFEEMREKQANFSVHTTDTNIQNFSSTIPDVSDYKIDGTTKKLQVKLPINFKKSISSQLWQYKCHVHSNLKNQIIEHNPQYFMKIDGRLPAIKMFESIQDRLKMLAFQPVLVPEKFTEEDDFGEFAMDIQSIPPETQPPEISFNNLRGKNIVGSMYKYQLSNWAFMCPVALKEGRLIQGKTEYAVKFMSKIFFLSSENALIKFYRNPRPYLLPIMPIPTCRIWVMGPRCSGRSVVAKCLSFFFNCKILDPTELETEYKKRKELDFLDKLRTAVISKALAELNEIREIERSQQIEEWKTKTLEVLKKVSIYKSKVKSIKSVKSELTPDEEILGEQEEMQKTESEILLEYELNELCLPTLSDSSISMLLEDTKSILDFLPESLKDPVESATVFDKFVCDEVKDAIQNAIIPDMSLSLEENVEMFKTEIDQAEEEYNLLFQRLGGWIIDGMPLNMELLEKLSPDYLPDDVICLHDEDDANHIFLLTKFSKKDFDTFKDYKQVFENLKIESLLDIKYSLVSTTSKIHFIESVVSEVEDRMLSSIDSGTTIESRTNEKNKAFEEHLNEFKEKWKIINEFITKHKILPLKINVENKSFPDLLKETLIALENRYRKITTVMTEQDRAQEQIDFGEPISGRLGEDFGEGAEEPSVDFFKENRRLGNTNIYCPVVFDRYFVLWKGKENFSVMFEQQVYLLSSEAAMNEFVINPRFFLKDDPPDDFPPARICIIGLPGSGKTSLATKLAENYGLHYVNFDKLILGYLNLPTNDDFELILGLDPTMNPISHNHIEDIEIVKNYIEKDIPLPVDIIKIVLAPLWFDERYKNLGFILDNFPRRLSDISIMIENFFIPDIIVELHVSQEFGSTRIMPNRFYKYRNEINEKRRLQDLENEKIRNKWYEERLERLQILAKEKQQLRKMQAMAQGFQNRKLVTTPVESGVSLEKIEEEIEEEILFGEEDEDWFVYDEIQEMEDLAEINKILDEEIPEPIFDDVWESEEETQQRILTTYDIDYNREINFIDTIRNSLQVENIDCAIVDTDNFSSEKVLYEAIRLVDKFKYRNKSLFERVYETTLDAAERLLIQGYYFISKFGRTCPVQIFENINPIQMFLPGETKMNLYPMIFKRYIYFIYGEESRDKFKNDPLKYVLNNDYKFSLIPFRVAIIGPPKSGKTTLAKRLEKEFQMKLISRGSAIRYMQKELPDSDLTKNINFILKKGWSATLEMVAKAVETLTMDTKSLSQGYILDGFPCTPQEMNHYKYLGIVPHIIIDIQTSIDKIKEHSVINFNRDPFPTYSFEYIKQFYEEWKKNAQHFRNYIYKEYQNIYNVENLDSKWHLWNQAKERIFSVMRDYQLYTKNKEFDKVLIVKSLCVTPSEFFLLQSVFLNYCPLCYHYDNYLLQSDPSPDRNCVVQYLGEYFYVCKKHQEHFIAFPERYIPPINEKLLPEDLPRIGNGKQCRSFYQDGLCIVSFWDNQPKYVLLKGDINFSVCYKGVNYLFCSEYCMKKFMRTPYVYYNKVIHFKMQSPLEVGELNKLPTLGYLEQLAARLLINAVIDVEIQRPYYVGLSIPKSAAIQIAIYLKRHNPKTPKLILPLYDEAKERLDERRAKFKSYLGYFKGRLNPYVHYEPRHVPQLKQVKSEEEIELIESDINKWLLANLSEPSHKYYGE